MFVAALIFGAGLAIALLIVRGTIKLWLPRSAGPRVDAVFDSFFRFLGRVASLAFVAIVGFLIWLFWFGGQQ
jgi:hypothetical protein